MFLIRSGAIEGYENYVAQLGHNPAAILASAGMSSAQLREPNAYISYSKMADLLDASAQVCGQPMFGMNLAMRQNPLVIGELALSSSQQPTLGESLQYTNQHLHLHASGVHIELAIDKRIAKVFYKFDFTNAYGLAQLIQLSAGQLFVSIRHMVENTCDPLKIHLRQAEPTGDFALDKNCWDLLVFNSDVDGVALPANWLRRKPHYNETLFREHFQHRIRLLENRYPNNLQAQARYIMSNLLASSECNVARVAAALSLHPRVLQKRLQKEGTNFSELLKSTRLDIARQHLLHSAMSITDLALNLGYAEVAVFSRHFKQWTGLSPRQWRQAYAN